MCKRRDMNTPREYDACLDAMYGMRRFGIKLELAAIRRMLGELGDPQKRFRAIHVAGTNGKGSIASALATILHRAGYRTGLFTSPHLVRFNERIRVDNREIDDDAVVRAYRAVKAVASGEREPTFFEFSTAMAFYEFARRGVQWAVVETGMGGRMDATNLLEPAVSIISNISMEHQMYLGNTIAQIAGEKAGIIKPKTPVVAGARQKSAIGVIKATARERSAPLHRYKTDFRVRREKNGAFTYYGLDHVWKGMRSGLAGGFQTDNAALTLAACEALMRRGVQLTVDDIRRGLITNQWPGRLEVASTSPYIILDGAHNFMAARNLGRFLSETLSDRDITLVAGILDDKPYRAMLKSMLPVCKRVVLTQARTGRALPPETLAEAAGERVSDITLIPDVAAAVDHAVRAAGPRDAVCIAGSLYVVGEARAALAQAGYINDP